MALDPTDDHYATLGVEPGADDEELRRAWRRLALQWHPDHAGPGTTAAFQRILAAYSVLSDPISRAEYDRRRGIARRPAEPAAPAPPIRRAPGVMIRRLSGPLNALLARGVAHMIADDLIEICLEPAEVDEGGMVTISMRVPVPCPACADTRGACATCGGTRSIEEVFSAWLAVRPGTADGTLLKPSALLPGMKPVAFRVRVGS